MMKLIFTFLIFIPFGIFAQNLVPNGGCEDPGTGGNNIPASWTNSGEIKCATTSVSGNKVNEGSYSFIENASGDHSVTQIIDLGVNRGGSTFDYSIDYNSFGASHDFSLLIEALDASDTDLGDLHNSGNITVSTSWNTHSGTTGAAPANTHKLRVTLTWVGQAGWHDAILDDLSISYNTILPVELVHFTGQISGKTVELNWKTASESNNEKFEVERSWNGTEFHKIGEVKGNGTTAEQQEYSFTIKNPRNGISYYRLKQIDYDEQFEYSKVISVDFKGENGDVGEFYPNPSKSGLVNLDYSSQNDDKISVSVFDVTGKLVVNQIQQVSNGESNLSFDFSELNTGIYIVKIGDEKNPIHRKLIIER